MMSIEGKGFNDEKFSFIQNADLSSSCSKHEFFSDMLLWLRRAATNPCNAKRSSEKARKRQILKMREVLFLNSTEMPWKKRKLHRIEERSRVTSVVALRKPNEQSSFASSVSHLINCADSNGSYEHILQNPHCSVRSMISHDNLPRKRIRNNLSLDRVDSICWSSNPQKPEFQIPRRSAQLLKSRTNLPFKQVCIFQADRANKNFSPVFDSDDSVDSSNESPEHPRLPNFINDYPRLAIPVGPRFQADVLDWTGLPTKENYSDARCNLEDSKWLGTKIWPTEGKYSNNCGEGIGKGKPYSCSCNSWVKKLPSHGLLKNRKASTCLSPRVRVS